MKAGFAAFAAADKSASRWPAAAIFLAAIATFVLVFHTYFSSVWVPLADNASNAMLVLDAKRFALLHGNYSRVGFYHPGPHLFYLMAAGEFLFHDLLGIARSTEAAQLLAVICLSVVALLIVERVYRDLAAGDVLISLCATAATALCVVAMVPDAFTSMWVPDTYVTSSLLFFLGGAALIVGRFRWLWVFVLGATMLMSGHASFLGLVPMMGAVLIAAVAALHPQARSVAGLRSVIRSHRGAIIASALILAIFLLPLVLQVVLHFPGEFGKYLEFAGKQPRKGWRAIAVVLLPYWKFAGVAFAVFLAGLLMRPKDALSAGSRQNVATAALAVFVAATGATLFYLQKGVDVISNENLYVVWWYQAAPAVCVGLAVVYAAPAAPKRAPLLAVLLLLVFATLWFTRWPDKLTNDSANVEKTMGLLQQKSRETGQPVRLALDATPSQLFDMWARAVGLIAEQERRGERVACIEEYSWQLSYHVRNRCAPADPNHRYARLVASYDDLTPIGGRRLWWFVGLQLFEFDPSNWPADRVRGPWVGSRDAAAGEPAPSGK